MSTKKYIKILITLIFVLGILLLLVVYLRTPKSTLDSYGLFFDKEILDKANGIKIFGVHEGKLKKIELIKNDDSWGIISRDLYPADLERISDSFNSMINAQIVEEKSDDEQLRFKFNLIDLTESNLNVEELLEKENEYLNNTGHYLGRVVEFSIYPDDPYNQSSYKRRYLLGIPSVGIWGQYVLRQFFSDDGNVNNEKPMVINTHIIFSLSEAEYIRRNMVEIEADNIEQFHVSYHRNREENVSVTRLGDSSHFYYKDISQRATADVASILNVGAGITAIDVIKKEKLDIPKEKITSFSVKSKEGLVFDLNIYRLAYTFPTDLDTPAVGIQSDDYQSDDSQSLDNQPGGYVNENNYIWEWSVKISDEKYSDQLENMVEEYNRLFNDFFFVVDDLKQEIFMQDTLNILVANSYIYRGSNYEGRDEDLIKYRPDSYIQN